MLNLSALEEAKRLTRSRDEQRQALAGQIYSESLALIERFGQTQDTACLRQALDKLQKSLATRSNQAEPYALLGLIFYGLRQPQLAGRYYQQARSLAPEAKLVLQLQAVMSGQKLPAAEADGGDELAGEAEALLKTLQQRLHSESFALTLDREQLAAQALRLRELREQENLLSRKLVLLSAEMDMLDLDHQLQTLAQELRSLGQQLRLSQEYQALAAEMRKLGEQVRHSREQLARKPLSPAELDHLLDHCDGIADKLDALEAAGHDIALLKPPYRDLTAALTLLQDLLDD